MDLHNIFVIIGNLVIAGCIWYFMKLLVKAFNKIADVLESHKVEIERLGLIIARQEQQKELSNENLQA